MVIVYLVYVVDYCVCQVGMKRVWATGQELGLILMNFGPSKKIAKRKEV